MGETIDLQVGSAIPANPEKRSSLMGNPDHMRYGINEAINHIHKRLDALDGAVAKAGSPVPNLTVRIETPAQDAWDEIKGKVIDTSNSTGTANTIGINRAKRLAFSALEEYIRNASPKNKGMLLCAIDVLER